jgi:hypothetical protein
MYWTETDVRSITGTKRKYDIKFINKISNKNMVNIKSTREQLQYATHYLQNRLKNVTKYRGQNDTKADHGQK